MADVVDKFYARANGQRINSCGGIFGECVAGVQSYTNVELGIGGCPAFPVPAARLMYGTRTDAFNWVANTPTGVPPRGAIVVWNGNTGGGYGHTGVIVEANVNQMRVYQQNDPKGSGMLVKTYNYNNVIGWAIPKNGQINPPQEGGDVMDLDAGVELYRVGLHREPENQAVAKQWNGKKPVDALRALKASNEWKLTNDKTLKFDSVVAENVKLKTDLTGVTNEVKKLSADIKLLNDQIKAQQKIIANLEKELANQSEDSANLNKLGEALKWVINRLGLK
jgi:hypothetical protein